MVSAAAGLARHGFLPVVNSFASFLASRANEQIYNQASEGTKVVYALHYAGLIPAGPGKSHQSVRDVSLLGALPNVTIVQPANAEETRALVRWAVEEAEESVALRLAIGPSPRRIELDGAPSPGRPRLLRDGADAVLVAYGPVMLHEALTRGGDPRRARGRARGREHAVAEPDRARRARRARRTSSCSRITLRSGGLGDALRRAGVRGARGLRRRGLARLRHARRGAPRPRPRRRFARRSHRARPLVVTDRRVWVVLPDLLSIRVFFDTGIVDGLRERLDGAITCVFLVSADAAPNGPIGWARRRSLHGAELARRLTGAGERVARRLDTWLDGQIGYYPLAIRLNDRHGFHASACSRAIRTGCSTRPARAGSRAPHAIERWMQRWFFSARRHVRARRARRDASATAAGLVVANVQPLSVVPYLAAARRLDLPVVAYVASWDHTVGKGVISPHCSRYVVQNAVMEDDLRRYHGIDPQPSRRHRLAADRRLQPYADPRASTTRSCDATGSIPTRPLVLVMGNTPTNAPYEGRFVERLARVVGGRPLETASSFSSARIRATGSGRSASRSRAVVDGVYLQEPSFTDLEELATLLQHARRRRRERGDDPPRRPRQRPAGRVRALRRGRAGRGVVGGEERRRQALRGARRVRRLLPRGELRGGRRGPRACAGPAGRARGRAPRASCARSSARSTGMRQSVPSTRSSERRGIEPVLAAPEPGGRWRGSRNAALRRTCSSSLALAVVRARRRSRSRSRRAGPRDLHPRVVRAAAGGGRAAAGAARARSGHRDRRRGAARRSGRWSPRWRWHCSTRCRFCAGGMWHAGSGAAVGAARCRAPSRLPQLRAALPPPRERCVVRRGIRARGVATTRFVEARSPGRAAAVGRGSRAARLFARSARS